MMPVRPQVPASETSERLPMHPVVPLGIGAHSGAEPLAFADVLAEIHRYSVIDDAAAGAMLGRAMTAFLDSGDASRIETVAGVSVKFYRQR
jgi:hypothetical protein